MHGGCFLPSLGGKEGTPSNFFCERLPLCNLKTISSKSFLDYIFLFIFLPVDSSLQHITNSPEGLCVFIVLCLDVVCGQESSTGHIWIGNPTQVPWGILGLLEGGGAGETPSSRATKAATTDHPEWNETFTFSTKEGVAALFCDDTYPPKRVAFPIQGRAKNPGASQPSGDSFPVGGGVWCSFEDPRDWARSRKNVACAFCQP